MPDWIDDYIKEVGPPAEFRHFALTTATTNIWVDNKPIGIIVYTITGEVLSVHTMWIKPKFRNNFRKACKYLCKWIKEQDCTKVEIICDMKATTLVERYLKVKPVQKIYLEDVDNILEVL